MNVVSNVALAGEGLTRRLAAEAAALRLGDLTADATAIARQCVLDTLGCALAGAGEALTTILLAEMEDQGGAAQATVIGHCARLPAASAALVNGAAGHALDFDDVNMAMPGHPSVAILPALLALAETRRPAAPTCSPPSPPATRCNVGSGGWSRRAITTASAFMRRRRSAASARQLRARICSASMPRRRRPPSASPARRRPA